MSKMALNPFCDETLHIIIYPNISIIIIISIMFIIIIIINNVIIILVIITLSSPLSLFLFGK